MRMRIIRKYYIVFLYFKFIIQVWSPVESEARSLNNMHYNFHRPQRHGLMSMDAYSAAHTDNTFETVGSDWIVPTPPKLKKRQMPDIGPQSFQDYLTTVIKAELQHKSRSTTNHSRKRRSKIKLIIKKIILFLKLLAKYFFFVAKKTAIIVG